MCRFPHRSIIHVLLSDDPCTKIHCGAGRICAVQDDSAQCICIPECPEENDPRRKVCTNRNETWGSDCEVHRQRCLCDTKDDRCTNAKNSHIHIDYYGECKQLQVKFLRFNSLHISTVSTITFFTLRETRPKGWLWLIDLIFESKSWLFSFH